MSVIIKGMEMPKKCGECPIMKFDGNGYICRLLGDSHKVSVGFPIRMSGCPLVELPEKHGRLIDADAYVSMMEGKCDYEKALDPYVLSVCCGGIKLMPTIVEAEGKEGGE